MAGIVPADRPEGLESLVQRQELKQTLARRIELVETGFHGDHGPARGEIANAAVAEPAAVGPHVNVLGDREFAPRARDEVAIAGHISGDRPRIEDTPAVGT